MKSTSMDGGSLRRSNHGSLQRPINGSVERMSRRNIANPSFMAINPEAIEKGKSEAAFAKDNLLVRKDDGYSPKVCCVCDRFIMM